METLTFLIIDVRLDNLVFWEHDISRVIAAKLIRHVMSCKLLTAVNLGRQLLVSL